MEKKKQDQSTNKKTNQASNTTKDASNCQNKQPNQPTNTTERNCK